MVDDWQGRAHRAATAILAEANVHRTVGYDDLERLMAIAWLRGVSDGSNDTLAAAVKQLRESFEAQR